MQKIHLLFLIALLLFGCRKGELINKVIVEEDDPTILVVSSFKGKVVDEAGEPVVGAMVRVYHETTTTNGKGLSTKRWRASFGLRCGGEKFAIRDL